MSSSETPEDIYKQKISELARDYCEGLSLVQSQYHRAIQEATKELLSHDVDFTKCHQIVDAAKISLERNLAYLKELEEAECTLL